MCEDIDGLFARLGIILGVAGLLLRRAVCVGSLDGRYPILTDERELKCNILKKHPAKVPTWCW